MRKFARWCFNSYVVTSINNNASYQLIELDGTRLVVPIAGKRLNIFKKGHVDVSNLDDLKKEDG